MGRSREGAWIEMLSRQMISATPVVAPARERGLKFYPHSSHNRP